MAKISKSSLYKYLLEQMTLNTNYIRLLEMNKPFAPKKEISELTKMLIIFTNDFTQHLNTQLKLLEKENGNKKL